MKKTVIINAHPDKESFCYALHDSYKRGSLAKGSDVSEIFIGELTFNPNLVYGYRKRTQQEPDLITAWQKIKDADHIVWIYPTWWGMPPAMLKGFIDRLFLPGCAFEYQERSPFPKPLLKGKTSEIISTMDTPVFYYKLVYKDIGGRFLRKNVGAFCGIKNIRTTYLSVVKNSTAEKREKWLEKVYKIAQ